MTQIVFIKTQPTSNKICQEKTNFPISNRSRVNRDYKILINLILLRYYSQSIKSISSLNKRLVKIKKLLSLKLNLGRLIFYFDISMQKIFSHHEICDNFGIFEDKKLGIETTEQET